MKVGGGQRSKTSKNIKNSYLVEVFVEMECWSDLLAKTI
jgi:hypothetical protein